MNLWSIHNYNNELSYNLICRCPKNSRIQCMHDKKRRVGQSILKLHKKIHEHQHITSVILQFC